MSEDLRKQAEEVLQQVETLRTVASRLEEKVKNKPEGARKEAAEKALEKFKPELIKLMDTVSTLYERANIEELDEMLIDGDTEALTDFLENLSDDFLGGPKDAKDTE